MFEFNPFERTPEQRQRDRAILNTVQPSDFIPKVGDHFRVRFSTIADRSYIDVLWKCIAFQDGAALAERVLGITYGKEPKLFIVGDVIFYDANDIGKALQTAVPASEVTPAAESGAKS